MLADVLVSSLAASSQVLILPMGLSLLSLSTPRTRRGLQALLLGE